MSIISKIYSDISELISTLEKVKNKKQKIVFTNGCFDILHKGHVIYLEEAKNLGDFLIVALNSDLSVKNLKGESRPIVDEKGRMAVLAALECVDAVLLFDEETPINLIKKINPDILVKGGDYPIHTIVGSDYVLQQGGVVKTLSLIEGYSTTLIEQKIKNSC
ncbi:MAG: D-glycero-beta-D-manno-heptose 1-phosphate adenylyltransferase [Saprospiraceae bacterium]|nr:D-glycero-beta-D-manno-heptose 1-phosphate adenylyltransferase [Saprospiraceae bacterium]MBK6564965.1 D-glycero-beta-D-manno-heptose 1-phosphate adenylyltransferase [Saprospiraceae bacterium]MBK7523604.1 D-glycero-beta-D-manno-heptose 1-phosphate adenylyltransferase [Saprospiraceae bacterium]MBK8079714.1 D-glycero-beta-D-manno-heptose 1-phosphate adenylyltransferase [Saprospiraceae bacterium]MBK8371406.1 D-glycero-beta-D-manno-heptose 1-phosphate adenylyltransferase [Saprospiraceae bacterium